MKNKKYEISQGMMEALEGSIKKWEGICGGDEVDRGSGNCSLCKYVEFDKTLECFNNYEECIILKDLLEKKEILSWERTRCGCWRTPYKQWSQSTNSGKRICNVESAMAANDMLDYLKNLKEKCEVKQEQEFFKMGDCFKYGVEYYILSRLRFDGTTNAAYFNLISLKKGYRYFYDMFEVPIDAIKEQNIPVDKFPKEFTENFVRVSKKEAFEATLKQLTLTDGK